jgi:ariadne-1
MFWYWYFLLNSYFILFLYLTGDWKEHASRGCNVYRQEELEKSQSEAREHLARYVHYFTRYQTHNQSLELEGKLLELVQKRIKQMQAEAMSYTEQKAIQRAFEVLQQCRRTLKYTYPFAYYLARTNQSEIFEQNQADLERATEILSGFLEQEMDAAQMTSLTLMDKTRYCEHRRKILVDSCKDGYSQHYWDGLDS